MFSRGYRESVRLSPSLVYWELSAVEVAVARLRARILIIVVGWRMRDAFSIL